MTRPMFRPSAAGGASCSARRRWRSSTASSRLPSKRAAWRRSNTAVEEDVSEHERWQGRYSIPDYLFGKAPNYFLASCKALLPKSGRALAVADGEARNGVWLAEQGLDVVSLDFSPSAQKKARALARERGVEVDFRQVDVHGWDYPADAFDVVV